MRLLILGTETPANLLEESLGPGTSHRRVVNLAEAGRLVAQDHFDLVMVDTATAFWSYAEIQKQLGGLPVLTIGDDEAERAASRGRPERTCVRRATLDGASLKVAIATALEQDRVERRRLAAVEAYKILDTPAEQSFDDLALLASHICQTPVALVTLINADRQWFKATVGTDIRNIPREISFCTHAIGRRELLVVNDATNDPRFATNPMVTGSPNIRFYAGAPLVTKGGDALGTLCVLDRTPRELRPDQAAALQALGRQVVDQLELRRVAATNAALYAKLKRSSRRRIEVAREAQKLAEEQCGLRQAVAGMEHVLGVVGHELRTPLAALRAISEFLITDGAAGTAEAERFMHDISEEVDRMSDTVDNLLEAARLNSGRATWKWAAVDVAGAVEDAVGSVRPLVDAAAVQLNIEFHGPIEPLRGDRDAIRRLLINLLSNARKHTHQGQIIVSARRYVDGAGPGVELEVRDTGCGIPPHRAARLGEAFALNAGVVGSNYVSGTGLGLAICKGIVDAHGGSLRILSVEGRGTTVTARLRTDLQTAVIGDAPHASRIEVVTR